LLCPRLHRPNCSAKQAPRAQRSSRVGPATHPGCRPLKLLDSRVSKIDRKGNKKTFFNQELFQQNQVFRREIGIERSRRAGVFSMQKVLPPWDKPSEVSTATWAASSRASAMWTQVERGKRRDEEVWACSNDIVSVGHVSLWCVAAN
jgi:hypothetical protein